MENTKKSSSLMQFLRDSKPIKLASPSMHWYYGPNLHSIRTFATKGRPNDLISDSITQIKNGYSRRFDKVYLSYSKEILQLLEALLQGGYIQNYAFNGASAKHQPSVDLVPLGTLTNAPYSPTEGIGEANIGESGAVPQQSLNTRSDRRSKALDKHIGAKQGAALIEVSLKYYQSLPAIKGIQRLSKPNKRLYFSKKKIIQVSQEQSWGENWTLFLSTSSGIMDHRQALDLKGIGGEGLCIVW